MLEEVKKYSSGSPNALKGFPRRLEVYTEAPLNTEVMDTIIRKWAEVPSILEIATKEIKQGQMSKWFGTRMLPLAE